MNQNIAALGIPLMGPEPSTTLAEVCVELFAIVYGSVGTLAVVAD
jgi:hypothetical protein